MERVKGHHRSPPRAPARVAFTGMAWRGEDENSGSL
jgi:hypothetical protein